MKTQFNLLVLVLTLLFFHQGFAQMVTIKTNKGDIVLELDSKKAPQTVENFLSYAKSGHYNGTIFHRVINGFMIQGGGFDQKMHQKTTKAPIKNEAANGLKNSKGTIAMARTSDPNSATSQFFINVADNNFLDYKGDAPSQIGYCVFGKVVKGMEVVDQIRKVPTTTMGPFQDVPREPVEILSVEVAEQKAN